MTKTPWRSSPPGAEDLVDRDRCAVLALGPQEAPAGEVTDRALHRALRESGLLGDLLETRLRPRPAAPARHPPQTEVDEIGGGALIVAGEIPHQRVEHVSVDA